MGNREPGASATRLGLAMADLREGAAMAHLWGRLGWQDVRARYRRTTLGPLWITLGMAATVALLGALFGRLFDADPAAYVPYVAVGVVVWAFVDDLVAGGATAFVRAAGIVKEVRLPLSMHVYRAVWRSVVVSLHNAVVVVGVFAVFSVGAGWATLLALPGLAVVCLNGVWAALVAGALSARFRDVPPIIASFMRFAFFATPIVWTPARLPDRAFLLELNPFHHLLHVVRAPLLGELPSPTSWFWAAGITVAGGAAALAVFARCRPRIAYWL